MMMMAMHSSSAAASEGSSEKEDGRRSVVVVSEEYRGGVKMMSLDALKPSSSSSDLCSRWTPGPPGGSKRRFALRAERFGDGVPSVGRFTPSRGAARERFTHRQRFHRLWYARRRVHGHGRIIQSR